MESGGSLLPHQQSVGEGWIYVQPTSYLPHSILDSAPAPQSFFKCSLTDFFFYTMHLFCHWGIWISSINFHLLLWWFRLNCLFLVSFLSLLKLTWSYLSYHIAVHHHTNSARLVDLPRSLKQGIGSELCRKPESAAWTSAGICCVEFFFGFEWVLWQNASISFSLHMV